MTMSLQGLPVLVEVFWKSGVALGVALCVNRLLQRQSADVRRLVLFQRNCRHVRGRISVAAVAALDCGYA
jgi:hypothetical protein